jgi:hypothetical protein
MKQLLEDKENTFSSFHTGRPSAERLSSEDKQRSSVASIWWLAEPILFAVDF